MRAPAAAPLPAGEGWEREKRPLPPTPEESPNHPPTPTVIPAQAGIQNPGQCRRNTGQGVDSRFRRNDDEANRNDLVQPEIPIRAPAAGLIPAEEGETPPTANPRHLSYPGRPEYNQPAISRDG